MPEEVKKISLKKMATWVVVLVISLFLVVQVASRILFANASHYREAIATVVSDKVKHPVSIQHIHATWYGIKPVLKLKNVDILTHDKTHTIAHIDKIFLRVNLIECITKRHFQPKELIVSGLTADVENKKTKLNAKIKWRSTFHGWAVSANNVQLASACTVLSQMDLLPKSVRQTLRKLAPSGRLKDIAIEKQAEHEYVASGHFTNLQVSPYHKIPGVNHLKGEFTFDEQHGELKLSAEDATIHDQAIFPERINISYFDTAINWRKEGNRWLVKAPKLDLQLPSARLSYQLNVGYDEADKNPLIDLVGQFSVSDMSQLHSYLPVKIMKPKLVDWINHAFQAGTMTDGKLALHGRLKSFPFDHDNGKFLVTAHVNNVELIIKKGWPLISTLNSDIKFEGRSFTMIADHAMVLNEQIDSANATIEDLMTPMLHANIKMNAALETGIQYIHQSPLEQKLGQQLAPLQLGGPMKLALHLRIPLKHGLPPTHVLGVVNMINSSLTIPDWRVSVEKLNGKLSFTERGINSDELTGQLYNQPVALKIDTSHGAHGAITTANIHGVLSDTAIKTIVPIPIVKHVQGASAFDATLTLHPYNSPNKDHFVLHTKLRNMAIHLPKPLNKVQGSELPLSIQVDLRHDSPADIHLAFADVAQMAFRIYQHTLRRAHIYFGSETALLPEDETIALDGKLDELNLSAWLGKIFVGGKKKASLPPLAKLNLQANTLLMFGQNIRGVHLTLTKKTKGTLVKLRSAKVNGDITIPQDFPGHAMDATFDRLHFYATKTANKSTLSPEDLPPMNITINDFSFEKLPLGRFELSVTPEKNSLKINELSFKSKLMSFFASGQWDKRDSNQKTVLSGALYTHNLGMMCNVFDITDNVSGGGGKALFNLQWADSLLNYNLELLNGRVNFGFTNGTITKLSHGANAKMGIGRVLNLFSLQNLPRRLALDFSDLTNDGFVFDDFSGHFMLRDGNAYSRDSKMLGSVAGVQMRGRLGLKSKDYQLNLAITPHVTSSLPVVATVAGGPVAGVATFMVEKLFRRAVNKVTTINYLVTGPWTHPKIAKESI